MLILPQPGFNEYTPQNDAGILLTGTDVRQRVGSSHMILTGDLLTDLREPPMSLPHPRAAPSTLRRAASPPLVPPDEYDRLNGLRVRPQTGLTHSKKNTSCATFVLAIGIPPA